MDMLLIRFRQDERGTLGLLVFGQDVMFVLERPWANNEHDVSCIPCGDYKVTWGPSIKHGACYHVHGVPDRSSIEIHPGNFIADTEGCLLPGRYSTDNTKELCVWESKSACALLHNVLGESATHNLSIRGVEGFNIK